MSDCSVSFTFSSPTSYIEHRNIDCEKAARMIFPYHTKNKDEYLSNVTLTKQTGLFHKQIQEYDYLSYKKFHCLLECGITKKNKNDYMKCIESCSKVINQIQLNHFDNSI